MRRDIQKLRPDDLIDVMYRDSGKGRDTDALWIRATIIYCEAGTWPLLITPTSPLPV